MKVIYSRPIPDLDEVTSRMADPAAMNGMLNWDRANQVISFYLAHGRGELEYGNCKVPTMGVWSSGDVYLWESWMTETEELMDAAVALRAYRGRQSLDDAGRARSSDEPVARLVFLNRGGRSKSMIDLLSSKASSGDIYINMAMQYLERHEWGQAMMAVEKAVAKGRLSEPDQVDAVLQEIRDRLGLGQTGLDS